MTSDSSDEENLELLREAQDDQFINDSMFSDKNEKTTILKERIVAPALRKAEDDDEQFNFFRVTPEFRKYIAKHLSAILDDQLIYKKDKIEVSNERSLKHGGIKLLKQSKYFLESDSHSYLNAISSKQSANNKKFKLFNNKGHISEKSMKEVVVSGDTILSKADVKYWSNRTKAPVFKYKKEKNGQLVLVEPAFH